MPRPSRQAVRAVNCRGTRRAPQLPPRYMRSRRRKATSPATASMTATTASQASGATVTGAPGSFGTWLKGEMSRCPGPAASRARVS